MPPRPVTVSTAEHPSPDPLEDANRPRGPLDDPEGFLTGAGMEIVGRLTSSSNVTLLVRLTGGDGTVRYGVYKPVAGERPLWDFPPGLHVRERAAHVLSEALGWGITPPTVLREDGPAGPGSVQLWVPAGPDHYFTLVEDPSHHDRLRLIAAFDIIANNCDRKSGHCLLDAGGVIRGIDHGLCFHEDLKLRTVIWDFAGDPLDAATRDAVTAVADDPPAELGELLTPAELSAFVHRCRRLVEAGRLPGDPTGRRIPWPLI